MGWRSGVEVYVVEAVEVAEAAGFRASYRRTTIDGARERGLALMLHGTDNRLHVANLRISDLDLNLLALDEAEAAQYPELAAVDSFRLLPELEVQAG